jgi:hypothetical protein
MKSILALVVAVFLFTPAAALSASDGNSEDKFYDGNNAGSAGWDMGYGPDEELDEKNAEEKAREEALKKKAEEQAKEKEQKSQDFFGDQVESVEKNVADDTKK